MAPDRHTHPKCTPANVPLHPSLGTHTLRSLHHLAAMQQMDAKGWCPRTYARHIPASVACPPPLLCPLPACPSQPLIVFRRRPLRRHGIGFSRRRGCPCWRPRAPSSIGSRPLGASTLYPRRAPCGACRCGRRGCPSRVPGEGCSSRLQATALRVGSRGGARSPSPSCQEAERCLPRPRLG